MVVHENEINTDID